MCTACFLLFSASRGARQEVVSIEPRYDAVRLELRHRWLLCGHFAMQLQPASPCRVVAPVSEAAISKSATQFSKQSVSVPFVHLYFQLLCLSATAAET